MVEIVSDDSFGDPRYLETARRALADIARVWGAEATEAAVEERKKRKLPKRFSIRLNTSSSDPKPGG